LSKAKKIKIDPKIKTLIKLTNKVAESECGKKEMKAVATPAMTKASNTERMRGLSMLEITDNF
jgi:hypothetical protein